MKHPISRRVFLRTLAAGSAAATLAACGAQTGSPATTEPATTAATTAPAVASGAAVPIEIWTGWTEQAATNIETILAGYNASQDKVVAKHVVVPEAMNQKLLAAVSAGTPPAAAIVFGAGTAYQLAAQGALLPLDEIGQPDQVATLKSWMAPPLWDLGTYDGKYYFASMWNQCWGMFVNTDMAQAAGVDPNAPPKTLEELGEVWDKLTVNDANGNISVLGGDFTDQNVLTARFLGQYAEADGKTTTANHPNNLKALEWISERWKRIGPDKLQDFYASLQNRGERSAGQDPFLSRLRATYVTGPWHFDTITKFKPADFNYTVWPLPSPASADKRGTYTYGDGWIIPKGSPAPEAAWQILSAMTGATGNRDVYTSLFTTWQCVNGPVSREMVTYPAFKANVIGKCPGYEEVFLSDLFDADTYLYPPKLPTSASYSDVMSAEWEKVRLGQKAPQEALDFVQETAQKELNDWYAQNPTT